MYNKRTWLNKETSSSTGSFVCYDGTYKSDEGDDVPWSYVEVADCHCKVRLHQSRSDTPQDFLDKLKLLHKELDTFIKYLETK